VNSVFLEIFTLIEDFGDSKYLRKKDIETLVQHLVGEAKIEREDMNRLVNKALI
jgi:hypothetical protein